MQKIGDVPNAHANEAGEFIEEDKRQGKVGTRIKANWLNTVQRELIAVVETFGGQLDSQNDQQLWETMDRITPIRLKKTAKPLSGVTSVRAMPFYPEIITPTHTLALMVSANTVKIQEGQALLWRGVWKIQTEDYLDEQRTFLLEPSKIYHLRWQPQAGFCLKNLSDPAYNPYFFAEVHAYFDSRYDDLLIARMITDQNAQPMITLLKNKSHLSTHWTTQSIEWWNGVVGNSVYFSYPPMASLSLNWGRTPLAHLWGISGFNLGSTYHVYGNSQLHAFGVRADRYEVRLYCAMQQVKTSDRTIWHVGIRA